MDGSAEHMLQENGLIYIKQPGLVVMPVEWPGHAPAHRTSEWARKRRSELLHKLRRYLVIRNRILFWITFPLSVIILLGAIAGIVWVASSHGVHGNSFLVLGAGGGMGVFWLYLMLGDIFTTDYDWVDSKKLSKKGRRFEY